MARQIIDTTTNNGTYIGDPAKIAFEKTNSNFQELYGFGGIPIAQSLSDKKIAIIAGTLRQSTSNLAQWSWINDGLHVPVGVGAASASGDTISISLDQTYGRVISIVAGPDETLAQMGVSVGASVNLDAFALRMSVNKSVAGHVRYLGGGRWEHKISTGKAVVDGPVPALVGTNLTVQHDSVPGGIYNHPSLTPYSNNADFIPRVATVRASTSTTFTVQFFNSTFDGFLGTADATNRFSLAYRKSFNGPINLDGTGPSGNIELYQGNIWVFGIMELA